VSLANANLATSLGYLRPLELDGVILVCRRVHLGTGIYPAGKTVGLHRHDDLQVEFVLCGEFRFADERGESAVRPGQCVVIPAGVPHRWRCTRRGVLLGAELAATGASAAAFLRDLSRATQGSFGRIDDERLALWAGQILEIALQPPPYAWRRAMLGSLLHVWFAQILKRTMAIEPWRQAIPYTKPVPGDRQRLLVRQVRDFLQANYAMPIGLREVADHHGITPRHLTRLFRQYGQESVNATLLQIRLRRAHELLAAAPAISVKEVAFRTGFASASYFTQCFRKTFGRLPSRVADAASLALGDGHA
jgi:AraC-like DNA-binding protein